MEGQRDRSYGPGSARCRRRIQHVMSRMMESVPSGPTSRCYQMKGNSFKMLLRRMQNTQCANATIVSIMHNATQGPRWVVCDVAKGVCDVSRGKSSPLPKASTWPRKASTSSLDDLPRSGPCDARSRQPGTPLPMCMGDVASRPNVASMVSLGLERWMSHPNLANTIPLHSPHAEQSARRPP